MACVIERVASSYRTAEVCKVALFANSLRCNGASAAEGRPSVARLASSRQPVTHKRNSAVEFAVMHKGAARLMVW
jgi:hypothetical protein